jgi:hypothetical protein
MQKYERSIRERMHPPFGCTIHICVKRAIPLTSRTLMAKKRDRIEERPGNAKNSESPLINELIQRNKRLLETRAVYSDAHALNLVSPSRFVAAINHQSNLLGALGRYLEHDLWVSQVALVDTQGVQVSN